MSDGGAPVVSLPKQAAEPPARQPRTPASAARARLELIEWRTAKPACWKRGLSAEVPAAVRVARRSDAFR